MSNLGPQHINLSYSGLLQVPNGITSVLQTVSDGNGNATGLQLSSTSIGGIVTATSLTVTGLTTLATSLSGVLKATSGVVSVASAGTDYVSPAVLGQPNGVATLDSAGQLPTSQLPPIAVVTYLGTVNSQAAMLALTGQQGDWCIRSDLGTTWVITGSNPSVLSSWTQLSYPTAPVTSVNGLTGAVSLSYTNVGAAPATTGNSILYANGLGGFSNVTVGSNLSFVGGTLSATASAGTVTSFSFTNGNGLTGSVTNPTTTPTLSLGTSVTGVLKGNGTAISAAVSGTDYAPATSGTSILKGNGSGGFASATVGTDYAPATTGTDILYGNGLGGFSGVTIGSGLTFSGGTLSSISGGGGTVTNVSVVTANGFAGTVANPSTLPAITLSTSVTGLLKGNGTAISAATAGTDYAAAPTGTSAQLLANDGAGGFTNVTVGTGLSYSTGTLSATGTGSVTAVTASSPLASSGGTAPNITIQQASSTQAGFLSSADWSTFNSKAPATSGTSILYGNGSGGFSNVSIGSNMTFSSGVLNANATTSTVGSPGYYGSFYDTNATQVAANTTTAYAIKLNSTAEANGVSIVNDPSGDPTLITFAYTGTYNIQYSIQLTNTDSSIHNVNVWLRKNNTGSVGDVPYSNSQYAIIGSHGGIAGQMIAAINYVISANAGDYFQLMWQPENTNVYIETIPAGTTPTSPASPGVILTAMQVSEIGIGYYGLTSSTSTLIGTGSKTFTTNLSATSTAFAVGTRIRLAYTTTPANFMEGVITSFSGTTLVVDVDNTGGSGTYASWQISVAGSFTATSGSSILYGNGAGGFSNVTVGSGLSFAGGTLSASSSAISITNDTSTSTNVYPAFVNATSGTVSTVYTGNANLLYKPSTGELQAQELIAANGLVVNSATVATSYSIPSGSNAMSAGPMTVASGITVTVSSGSVWTVV